MVLQISWPTFTFVCFYMTPCHIQKRTPRHNSFSKRLASQRSLSSLDFLRDQANLVYPCAPCDIDDIGYVIELQLRIPLNEHGPFVPSFENFREPIEKKPLIHSFLVNFNSPISID